MNKLTTSEIQQIVSNVTKISVTDIISKSRKAEIVQARHLSCTELCTCAKYLQSAEL